MIPALVVKLGGSHARSALRAPWLRAIAAAAGRACLVPGGGPFADAVRAMQPEMGYDNATAHEMALLAMAQYGLVLAASGPPFEPAGTRAAIADALARRRVPVWLPSAMLRDAGVAPGWDVTSDSLALWLARALGAPALLLIKHACPRAGLDGLLDPAFPRFLTGYAGRVFVAGPDDLPARLDPDRLPGWPLAVPA